MLAGVMTRATPLPPDERRAALIAVTRQLLLDHGHDVTTRQVAEAAGVAEGTVFRVFPTRHDLIVATITDALSRSRLTELLDSVEESTTLDATVETGIVAVADYSRSSIQLLRRPDHPRRSRDCDPHPTPGEVWRDRIVDLRGWLRDRLTPFTAELVPTPAEFSHVVLTLALGHAHSDHSPDHPDPALLTRIALDGARRKES